MFFLCFQFSIKCLRIFERILTINFRFEVKFTVRISCLEIYHEHVYDLSVEEKDRVSLSVREHSTDGFFLEGARLCSCPTYKDAAKFVDLAMKNRQIGEHDMNSRSNRSHCITDLYIDLPRNSPDDATPDSNNQAEVRDFKLNGRMTFVDLAGSERLKSTQSTGKVLQEAGFINRSLYVLGKVLAPNSALLSVQ